MTHATISPKASFMKALHAGSTSKTVHLRCVLLQFTVNKEMQVMIVKNISKHHHQSILQLLTNKYEVCQYTSKLTDEGKAIGKESKLASSIYFMAVSYILYMYNEKRRI